MIKAALLAVAIPFSFSLLVAPAQAQSVRTYVSSVGNDGNFCGRLTPCRTFQAAHDKTLPGGEITVLDQGNFATVTITKAISIVNEGIGQASILVGNGDVGVTINAPDAAVNLRGLTIEGVGPSRGVLVSGVLFLTMTNCIVRNHTGDAIDIIPASNGHIEISNTLVTDNSGNGIYIEPRGSADLTILLNRVEVNNNSAHGVGLSGSVGRGRVRATMLDSVAARNGMSGVVTSTADPGAGVFISVFRSAVVSNNIGVWGEGVLTSFITVGGSILQGNNADIRGPVGSYGDNYVSRADNQFIGVVPKR